MGMASKLNDCAQVLANQLTGTWTTIVLLATITGPRQNWLIGTSTAPAIPVSMATPSNYTRFPTADSLAPMSNDWMSWRQSSLGPWGP